MFSDTVIQRLGISIGKLSNMVSFFFPQIIPAFQFCVTLRAHRTLPSFLACLAVWNSNT